MSPADLREILERDVLEGAISLLGWDILKGKMRARIVEVEAYRGEDDPGSHAYRGLKNRNRAMFGSPGNAYVYFTYGNHWMLNVTSLPEGEGAAVLIRAAKPLRDLHPMRERRPKARHDQDLLSGPAKLTAAFDITGNDYGIDLLDPRSELRIEFGMALKNIVFGTRIGLKVGYGDNLPWRFCDANELEWASRPQKNLREMNSLADLRV